MSRDESQSAETPNFEHALGQLEAIVQELEEGSIGLSDALARYEQGVRLLKQCYSLLERAERKIELLTGIDAAGEPLVSAVGDEEQTLEQKSRTRGRRRSAGSATRPVDECPDADIDAF